MPMLLYGNGMISGATSLVTPSSITMSGAGTISGNTSFLNGLSVTGSMTNISPTSLGVYIGRDPAAPNNAGIDIACSPTGYGWLDFTGSTGADAVGRVGYSLSTNAMELITNSATRVVINSSGIVTMPYQPAFRAYSSSGSYSTTGVDIAFGTTDFNVGSHYNTSNGRFTAPVSGVYHIIWSTSSFGAASFSLDLFINGNSLAYSEQNNSLTYFVTGQSQLRYLNAGDYATLRLRFGTINLSYPSTNFQAFLVG